MESQGFCETTLERFRVTECKCDTYEGNLGSCKSFDKGINGRCVTTPIALGAWVLGGSASSRMARQSDS